MRPDILISRGIELVQGGVGKISRKKTQKIPTSSSFATPISEAEHESLERLPRFVVPERNHN